MNDPVVENDNKQLMAYALNMLQALAADDAVIEARIVGGAVRDSILGVPIRDIDVLVQFKDSANATVRRGAITAAFGDDVDSVDAEAELYGEEEEIFQRVHTTIGFDFEFIDTGARSLDFVIDTYPDDISMVSMQADGTVVQSDKFIDALGTEVVTVQYGHGPRTRKLMGKLPGFGFKYPDGTYIRERGSDAPLKALSFAEILQGMQTTSTNA